MSETYSKNYFEKYAALTLAAFFDIDEKDILLSDRPDLRIPLYHHGIEVTQALTPEEAVADMKKPLYKTLDMTPFDHDDQNISFVFEKIDDAIERKLIKCKKYERYLHNGLYIFSHCHNLSQESLKTFLIQKDVPHDFYHYLFINCVTKLYCFDILKQTIHSLSFRRNELIKMNIQSLLYEKTCHKKRRKIIIP